MGGGSNEILKDLCKSKSLKVKGTSLKVDWHPILSGNSKKNHQKDKNGANKADC